MLISLLAYSQLSMNTPVRTFKVIDASPSGKSLRLGRGYFDNIRVGDEGEFFLGYDKATLIGIGEAIKVGNTESYWYFKKVIIGGGFIKGKRVIYFNTKSRQRVISKEIHDDIDDIEYIEREHY